MKRFVTTYTGDDGHRYGGEVDALDFEHAQAICDERGKGETVEGVLYLVIDAKAGVEFADRKLRELAEENPEPPDAWEFQIGDENNPSGAEVAPDY